jgi:lantibiotic biosynthesis protein
MRGNARAAQLADRLATPEEWARRVPPWWRQSLAVGGLAVALLHVQRARAELAPWERAHDWLAFAAGGPTDTGPGSHLYYGAPALAYVLHTTGRYQRALHTLDEQVTAATRRRLADAHRRIDTGRPPAIAEYDTLRGLSGLGALWMRRDPDGHLVRDILDYLVRLTQPLRLDGEELPGWWTLLAPSGRPDPDFPGGHANHGVAHGIGGPLALLATAARAGIRVSGHDDAMLRICSWLDRWRRPGPSGWWPYWITREEHWIGISERRTPGRPSWCYGTAGLARAQQLAGIALRDTERQCSAEAALAAAANDPAVTHVLDDSALCHGVAGIWLATTRAADDATNPTLRNAERALRTVMLDDDHAPRISVGHNLGLLEGPTGVALALSPIPAGWDVCLLTT